MSTPDDTPGRFVGSVADKLTEIARTARQADPRPFAQQEVSALEILARYVRGLARREGDDYRLRTLFFASGRPDYEPGPWAARMLGKLGMDYLAEIDPGEALLQLAMLSVRDRVAAVDEHEGALARERAELASRLQELAGLGAELAAVQARAGALEEDNGRLRAEMPVLHPSRSQVPCERCDQKSRLFVANHLLGFWRSLEDDEETGPDARASRASEPPRDKRVRVEGEPYITKRVLRRGGETFYVWGPDPEKGGKVDHVNAGHSLEEARELRDRLYAQPPAEVSTIVETGSIEAGAELSPGEPQQAGQVGSLREVIERIGGPE